MLGVEFLNEWFSNLLAAVLPAVKSALGLNYIQVSLLFTILEGTDVLSDGIFGVLGDLWSRRVLITAGTIAAGLGLVCMGIAPGYVVLLLGVTLHGLAGGPFVGLSQASLMDASPGKHDSMMAWWTIIGDIGFLVTPLMVTIAYTLGINWRPLFLVGGGLFFIYALFLAGMRFPRPGTSSEGEEEVETTFSSRLAAIKAAALNLDLLRWALILPLLEMPVNAFVVLYFHDVVGLRGNSSLGAAVCQWGMPVEMERLAWNCELRPVPGSSRRWSKICHSGIVQPGRVKLVSTGQGPGLRNTPWPVGGSTECHLAALAGYQFLAPARGRHRQPGRASLGIERAACGTSSGRSFAGACQLT